MPADGPEPVTPLWKAVEIVTRCGVFRAQRGPKAARGVRYIGEDQEANIPDTLAAAVAVRDEGDCRSADGTPTDPGMNGHDGNRRSLTGKEDVRADWTRRVAART